MKFEELPLEVQLIAAQALAEKIAPCSVLIPKKEIEPAIKLAREIRDAFVTLYSLAESPDSVKECSEGRSGSSVALCELNMYT